MQNLKKSITLTLAAFTLATASIQPARALIFGPATVVGGYIGGALIFGGGVDFFALSPSYPGEGTNWSALSAVGAVLIGVLLLDDNGALTPDMAPLTAATATKFQLTPDELASYNDELPLVNALNEQNTYDGNQLLAQGMGKAQVDQAIQAEWKSQAAQALSPATLSALDKITVQN